MSASDVMKAAKTAQVRESVERGGRSPDAQQNRDLNEAAMDVADDTNVPIDEPGSRPATQQDIQPDEPKPINEPRRSPFEQRRADIIARFREKRAEDSDDSDDNTRDIRRLARDGMPPELQPIADVDVDVNDPDLADADPLPESPAEAEAPEPTKRKIKVRGKEIEVTDDELLAFAQKGAAGDDYLSEARRTLDEVKALQAQTRAPGQAPASGTHPAGDDATQSNVGSTQQEVGDEHHVDPFFKAAETMQLGTPEEAATEMRRSVEDTVTNATKRVIEGERLRDEVARSHRYLKDFQDANPALLQDTLAQAVIERKLYDLQVEDIKALGINDAQLPKTPTDIANWHLYYRANGYKTRNIPDLLNTARDEVNKWRGVATPSATSTEPAARKAEPRVEVTVDRAQRRAAIPQQPSRSNAPARPAQQAPAPQRDRSSVVEQMIAARARPRGKTMGT